MIKTNLKLIGSVVVFLVAACGAKENAEPSVQDTQEAVVEGASAEAAAMQSAEGEQAATSLAQIGQMVSDDLETIAGNEWASGWSQVRSESAPKSPECRSVIVETDFADLDAPECCATDADCDPLCDSSARWDAFVAGHQDENGNLVADVAITVEYDMCQAAINGEDWTLDGRYRAAASLLVSKGALGTYGDLVVSLEGSALNVGITFGTETEAYSLSRADNPETAEEDETKTIALAGSSELTLGGAVITLGFSEFAIAVDSTSIQFDGTISSTRIDDVSNIKMDGTIVVLGTATVEDIEIEQDCDPRQSVEHLCTVLANFTFESVTLTLTDVRFTATREDEGESDMVSDLACPSAGEIDVVITGTLHGDVYDGTVEDGEEPMFSYDVEDASICAAAEFSSSDSSCTIEVSNYTEAGNAEGRMTLACTDQATACRAVTIDSSFDPEEDIEECLQ